MDIVQKKSIQSMSEGIFVNVNIFVCFFIDVPQVIYL